MLKVPPSLMELYFKFDLERDYTRHCGGGDSAQHWGAASQPADWSGLWTRVLESIPGVFVRTGNSDLEFGIDSVAGFN